MDSENDIYEMCRLCLAKEQVDVHIFEKESEEKQIFLKISTCLPIKISFDDRFPKKICTDCSFKLDAMYQFWNKSVSSEKQLLSWLDLNTIENVSTPDDRLNPINLHSHIYVKEEPIDCLKTEHDIKLEVMEESYDDESYNQPINEFPDQEASSHCKRKRDTSPGCEINSDDDPLAQETETKEHVNISVADEGPKCLNSSVHSRTTVPKGEGNNVDDISHISADLDEEPSTSIASTCNKITCLFCNCKQRRCGKRKLNLIFPQSEKITERIKNIAEQFCDLDILSKLENQTVAYHQSCCAGYQLKKKPRTEEHVDSSWHKYRYIHKLAFESIKYFITKEIIENNKVMYFSQLFGRYQALLLEFGDQEIDFDDIKNYRPDMLQKKLLKIFNRRVSIEASTGPRNQKIIYKTDIDISVMANNTKFLETKDDHKLEDVAYYLRSCIKNIDSHLVPKHLTVDDIIQGECTIPQQLFYFMQNLIQGPNVSEENFNQTMIKVTSICSDIIYAVKQ